MFGEYTIPLIFYLIFLLNTLIVIILEILEEI